MDDVANKIDFAGWLLSELEGRGMSQAELAREAGVTRSAINGILTGARGPGPDLSTAIAIALGYSPEYVFRQAGILPAEEGDEDPPGILELNEIFKNASPSEREEMLEYVRWRAQKAQDEGGRVGKRGLRPREV